MAALEKPSLHTEPVSLRFFSPPFEPSLRDRQSEDKDEDDNEAVKDPVRILPAMYEDVAEKADNVG